MALYYPPITPRSPIFANSNYAIPNTPVSAGGTGTITEEFLATNYLQFPGAQGVENFGFKELQLTSTNLGETATLYINPNSGQDVVLESVQTDGSLTIQTSATTNNTMVLSPSTGLTFGDGTTQTTAYNDINTVQTDQVNTFLAPYLQTFNGPVNLNGATNGITQLSGNNSTLLATTAFVQDAVQVSGVQTTDSPLLWQGANTWQYNSGTPATLPYSYPYGISNLWNLTGGQGDCNLVCNSGTGDWDNAFRIYCVPNNITGTALSSITDPQFQLSNNGTSAFIRDGINVNNKNISNINTLSGNSTSAISVSSPIDVNANLTCNDLTISSTNGTSSLAYYTANNLSLVIGNTDTFYIQTIGGTNLMTLNTTEIDALKTFNMNANNITGIGALSGNGGNISCNSNLLIGTGNTLNLQNNNINNVNTINAGGVGGYVQTNTPIYPDDSDKIATTAFVIDAIANIPPASGFARLSQGGVQTWSGNNTCSNGTWDFQTNSTVLVTTQGNNTNNNSVASTQFVKANAGIFTQTSITATSSVYYSITPSPVNVISTYTSANNVVSFNSVSFNIVIGTVPTFLLANLNFSASPFPGAPPSQPGQTISMYCSNGTTYAGTLNWISATQIVIGPPAGSVSLSSGMTFSVNLSTLGAFTP
jgi:hypothetical protein